MTVRLGNDLISKLYLGSTEIERAHLGSDLVYSTPATISGVGYNGQTLTSDKGGGQWYADGSPISGETGLTYVVDSTTEGASFTYRIAGTDSNALHHWVPRDAGNTALLSDPSDFSSLVLFGNNVQQINDQSGNDRHWKSPAVTNRPLSGSLTLNGLNVLDFGSDDYMQLDASDRFNQAQTVLLVGRGGTSNSAMLTGTLSGSIFSPAWNVTNTTLNYRGDTNTSTRAKTLSPADPSGFGIGVVGLLDAANQVKLYGYDGAATTFSHSIASKDLLVDTLGRDRAGTPQYSEGDLAYLVVINTLITDDLAQRLQGFAAHRYGMTGSLDAGHAYKTTPPNA